MKRLWMLGAVVCVAALDAGGLMAQRPAGSRASLFDLGVYAGGSLTSPWYESRMVTVNGQDTMDGPSQDYSIGYAPIVGLTATFWATPVIGIRLHGAYMPSQVPFASDGFFDTPEGVTDRGRYVLNNYLYDLNLALRPFIMRGDLSAALRSVYVFAGGGGFTTNAAGSGPGCEPFTLSRGACLPLGPSHATNGQATLGAGMALLPLGTSVALFGEAAVHGYSPPVRVSDGWLPPVQVPRGSQVAVADKGLAFTPRLVAGVKLMLGDMTPVPVVPPVTPPPPPPPAPAPPAPPAERTIQVCVIQDGTVGNVEATFVPATGDTVVMRNGQRVQFAQAFPGQPGYAAGANWFVGGEPITFQNQRYVRFGLPRVITPPDQVARIGEFQGVPVFAEPGATGAPSVIYLPIRPTCEFQPYQREAVTRRVRG